MELRIAQAQYYSNISIQGILYCHGLVLALQVEAIARLQECINFEIPDLAGREASHPLANSSESCCTHLKNSSMLPFGAHVHNPLDFFFTISQIVFFFIKQQFILITTAPSAGQQLRNLVHTSDQNFQLHTIRSIFKLLNANFHHFIIIMYCCPVFNHIADLLQLKPFRQLLCYYDTYNIMH